MSSKKQMNKSSNEPIINQTLEEMLAEELAEGFGEDDFVVQNLRRQINAQKRKETGQEMYYNAPID